MFDPTIYENLKVVLEGAVYDLDLDGTIVVTGRSDLVDLATMSRTYRIRFRLKHGHASAELCLCAELADLAGEMLEWRDAQPGSRLELLFTISLHNPETACPQIQKLVDQVWDGRPTVSQTLSFPYGEEGTSCTNDIRIQFDRKIGEEQVGDIPGLLDHCVRTLQRIELFHEGGNS